MVKIQCVGGSDDYDWQFEQVPQGWYARENKIYVPKGRLGQDDYHGIKVKVFDKLFNSLVQKSIFFNVLDDQVDDCFEDDYNVDLEDERKTKEIVRKRREARG